MGSSFGRSLGSGPAVTLQERRPERELRMHTCNNTHKTQTAAQKRSDDRMFNFADHNKDGKLDADEVFMMALPQYWPNKQEWYDFKAGDHMDTMDLNQDGFVDWKEYNNEMKQVIDGWDTGIGVSVKTGDLHIEV